MTFPPEVWEGVLHRLAAELPRFAIDSWIAPLVPEQRGGALRLLSPTSFHRDRVRDQLLGRIRELVREEIANESKAPGGASSNGLDVQIEVGGSKEARREARRRAGEVCEKLLTETSAASADSDRAARPDGAVERGGPTACEPAQAPRHARLARAVRPTRLVAGPPDRPRSMMSVDTQRSAAQPAQQSFDNFVVGPCNALAREASLAIATARHTDLRQLYISSQPGLGKTHLARAVCAAAAGHERVRFTRAETFTNDFMAAVRGNAMTAFKQRYRRSCDLLVIDDVPFLAGKVGTQLELFHTIEQIIDSGGRVVVTGCRAPAELDALEPQLRSQVSGGFIAMIETPDPELRREVLRAKASAGGVRLPDDCLDLLVEALAPSLRELDGALVQLVTTASLLKRPIDAALAREVLAAKGAIPRADAVAPTPELVVEVVAQFFKTTPEALTSRSRRRDVLVPRQLAMYLCRRFTQATLAEIGEALGRDHPAVRNAIARVEREVTERAKVRYQLEAVSERVRERLGR